MLSIQHVKKTYVQWDTNSQIFRDLNFDIESGKFICIIGRSGTGKTTLLNLIAGLTPFDSGEITLGDMKYSEKTSDELTGFRGGNISFIFQQFHLIPNLTVEENVELPLRINAIKPRYQIDEILERVGLGWKLHSYPYELSGGEQQRVAVARAFIGQTPLLLADEPTGNLDTENATKIMQLLKDLHAETKNTIILITHDHELAHFADATYELSDGNLQLTNV